MRNLLHSNQATTTLRARAEVVKDVLRAVGGVSGDVAAEQTGQSAYQPGSQVLPPPTIVVLKHSLPGQTYGDVATLVDVLRANGVVTCSPTITETKDGDVFADLVENDDKFQLYTVPTSVAALLNSKMPSLLEIGTLRCLNFSENLQCDENVLPFYLSWSQENHSQW
mmetsp:Transcript_22395/g.53007  ORF Transcript_22395/g.53007 Transcript_22395/m.53007 type:complete len:167 (+) Transcript_22395:1-501(+)